MHADGQRDGDDGRQALGDGGHRQGDGAQHGVGERLALGQAGGEHDGHRHPGHDGEPLARDGRAAPGAGVASVPASFIRPATRPISVSMPVPVTSSSARPRTSVVFMKPQVPAVADPVVEPVELVGGLVHRHRLAGERGLVDRDGDGGEEASVRRDAVAGLEQDDVARHEIVGRDLRRPRPSGAPGSG